jgi:hypothetical protein
MFQDYAVDPTRLQQTEIPIRPDAPGTNSAPAPPTPRMVTIRLTNHTSSNASAPTWNKTVSLPILLAAFIDQAGATFDVQSSEPDIISGKGVFNRPGP